MEVYVRIQGHELLRGDTEYTLVKIKGKKKRKKKQPKRWKFVTDN